MIIALGTVISSLFADKLIYKLGTGKVTDISVLMIAVALFGFSVTDEFIILCLFAIPYGLGAGAVDAALNNFVALHYSSKHMSWLHCFWGVGAAIGLYILIAFFCYSAVEQTTFLWCASYLVINRGIRNETAAKFASFVYIGITVGRFLCGFVADRLGDRKMIRMGIVVIVVGLALMFIPTGLDTIPLTALIIVGLGCAPIYPSIIHSTLFNFGKENSQLVIGIQMAFAYVGTTFMPPLFGIISQHITIALFPVYILIFTLLMLLSTERLNKMKSVNERN